MKVLQLLVCICSWLICSGCVTTDSYPADWPRPVTIEVASGCPDISGHYTVVGNTSDGNGTRNLGYLLLNANVDHESMRLILSGDELTIGVSGVAGEGDAEQTVLRRNVDFDCRGGKLWTKSSQWVGVMDSIPAYGRESGETGFSLTENGSLLGESHGSVAGIGLIVIIPVPFGGKVNEFTLWQPVAAE